MTVMSPAVRTATTSAAPAIAPIDLRRVTGARPATPAGPSGPTPPVPARRPHPRPREEHDPRQGRHRVDPRRPGQPRQHGHPPQGRGPPRVAERPEPRQRVQGHRHEQRQPHEPTIRTRRPSMSVRNSSQPSANPAGRAIRRVNPTSPAVFFASDSGLRPQRPRGRGAPLVVWNRSERRPVLVER